ncbi:unnamed protein product [Calypogeia fissa]
MRLVARSFAEAAGWWRTAESRDEEHRKSGLDSEGFTRIIFTASWNSTKRRKKSTVPETKKKNKRGRLSEDGKTSMAGLPAPFAAADEALKQAIQLLKSFPTDPERIRADILSLLPEFTEELAAAQKFHAASSGTATATEVPNGHPEEQKELAPFGDAEWLTYLELKFVLRSHRMRLVRTLGRYIWGNSHETNNTIQISFA